MATATRPTTGRLKRAPDERINVVHSIPFFLIHVLAFGGLLAALIKGLDERTLVMAFVLYYGRMFFISAGYHRYFAHKGYELNRFWAFVMAFGGASAAQKGPLWWAANHRDHHRYSDSDQDVHSPRKGFWWSHMGWFLCGKFKATKLNRIPDFAKYPEIRWIDKYNFIPSWGLAIACWWLLGWQGLFIGFFLSTVWLWHGTFTVNSLNHVWGTRRYPTRPLTDTSRNNALIVLWTLGEGWHNNHHYHPASARQGFLWWEIDISYYILRLLSFIGITKNLKLPSKAVVFPDRQLTPAIK